MAITEPNDNGFSGTLVAPPLHPPNVVFQDTHGHDVNLARPAPGKATVLFFGYTHCRDICPTTMADLAAARRKLAPSLKDKVDIVFVSVDPQRDTPRVLQRWLNRYDNDFVGLIGSIKLVHRAEHSVYASQSRIEPAQAQPGHHQASSSRRGADFEVSHPGTVYVLGPDDQSLIYTGGTTADRFAQDFGRLLERK